MQQVNTECFSKEINFILKEVLYLCPFQIFILKKGKHLTFIDHVSSEPCDRRSPYMLPFVFSQQLCEEVLLYGSLENPGM